MDMDSGLVAPKSKHFGFQYKLIGEASNSLIIPIKKMTFRPKSLYLRPKIQCKTSAKSLNLLSTSWNCSRELEVVSLEA